MRNMRICIIQSCYIPWKGFFDLIGRCDEYVIYDSVQYVKGHWHNRNKIKTLQGTSWLTIPVATAGRLGQAIVDVEVGKPWAEAHWNAIARAYSHAPFFPVFGPMVQTWYEQASELTHLTAINELFLRRMADVFGIGTRILRDDAYPAGGIKSDRLVSMCTAAGATRYLSGPSALVYLDKSLFTDAGISVEWMTYKGYPEYDQLHGPFDHAVTMLDVLFNVGINRPSVWKTHG